VDCHSPPLLFGTGCPIETVAVFAVVSEFVTSSEDPVLFVTLRTVIQRRANEPAAGWSLSVIVLFI
jgi:hypothetical protein